MAQHAGGIAVVLLRYEHGHARVGDAPSIAGDDAGAAQLARADGCVTAQEIRRVVGVDAGVDILRQRVGLGNLGVGIAVVDILAGAVGEQLALHVAANLGRIFIVHAGAVLQIGDHPVQRRLIGRGDAAVKLLLEGQLALDSRREAVGQRLHHGVVLLLLLNRQLTLLIARHGLIAGLQVFDLLLRRGVQFGHIIGQGVQQAAELLQIEPVAVVGAVLQQLDVLHGLLLGVAGSAGGLSGIDGRHGGVVSLLHLLPLLGGEVALGVILVIIDGVQLRFQLLLHGAQIAGSRYMHQHGSTHGVAALVVHTEGIQQGIALVVQGHGGLAGGVGNGVGIHAHIAGGGSVGGGGSLAAVDARAGHGAAAAAVVEGQRVVRRHGHGEGLARLRLHRGGDGAVPEPVGVAVERHGIGAHLAGIQNLLGVHPYDGQFVAVVQLGGLECAVFTAGIGQIAVHVHAAVIQHLAVQKYQSIARSKIAAACQQTPAVQRVIGAGVGIQRQGAGIDMLVAVRGVGPAAAVHVVGVQHGHLYRDLALGVRLQSVDGLAQFTQNLGHRLGFILAYVAHCRIGGQCQSCCPGVPQGRHALGGIAAQLVRVVLFRQILDGLNLQLYDGLAGGSALCIQLFAGGFQLRGQCLNRGLLFGLVVGQVGAAVVVEHAGHQGLGLVPDGLVRRPGLGGVSTVVAGRGALQRLVQHRGIGLAGGDQVGDSGLNIVCGILKSIYRFCNLVGCCVFISKHSPCTSSQLLIITPETIGAGAAAIIAVILRIIPVCRKGCQCLFQLGLIHNFNSHFGKCENGVTAIGIRCILREILCAQGRYSGFTLEPHRILFDAARICSCVIACFDVINILNIANCNGMKILGTLCADGNVGRIRVLHRSLITTSNTTQVARNCALCVGICY